MILGGPGQNMPAPRASTGGMLGRLANILGRNQQIATQHVLRKDLATHQANVQTRALDERNANSTNQLTNLMGLASLKHPEGHPQAGQLVHPELAHHINNAGVQGAFGFKFGSQYSPIKNSGQPAPQEKNAGFDDTHLAVSQGFITPEQGSEISPKFKTQYEGYKLKNPGYKGSSEEHIARVNSNVDNLPLGENK